MAFSYDTSTLNPPAPRAASGDGTFTWNPAATQVPGAIQPAPISPNPSGDSLGGGAGADLFGGGTAAPTTPTYNMPDYQALINQYMAPITAQFGADSAADRASRNAGFQRAIIQFGEMPDLVGVASALGLSRNDLGSAIPSGTKKLAKQNTAAGTSTVFRLNEAHNDAVRNVVNTLAARGILHSGETAFQRGRADLNYTQSQYDARNKLLDYLSGLQSGYVSAERQRQLALAQQAMQTASMIGSLYSPTPGAAPVSAGGGPSFSDVLAAAPAPDWLAPSAGSLGGSAAPPPPSDPYTRRGLGY